MASVSVKLGCGSATTCAMHKFIALAPMIKIAPTAALGRRVQLPKRPTQRDHLFAVILGPFHESDVHRLTHVVVVPLAPTGCRIVRSCFGSNTPSRNAPATPLLARLAGAAFVVAPSGPAQRNLRMPLRPLPRISARKRSALPQRCIRFARIRWRWIAFRPHRSRVQKCSDRAYLGQPV